MLDYSDIIHDTISLLRLGVGIDQIKTKLADIGMDSIPKEAEEQMEICAMVWKHYDGMKTKRPEELYPYLAEVSQMEVN
uniref:Uncharacterized protein n=1 Tax=viral metagenome TaxID=1070528 RepID=A0A6M3LR73_9ZZZZ